MEGNCSNFRVIDVEENCIKKAPLNALYVALSYVQDDGPCLALTKENHSQLSKPGSLLIFKDQLPQVILDATYLLSELGIRYLWVNGLCLLQDDEYDQSLGLEMMHSIIGGSYFTIISAAQDPSVGLYEAQKPQDVEDLNSELQMSVVHSAQWHIEQSPHGKSAWSYPATVLPKRVVVFAQGKVFFRCQRADWSVDTWADKFDTWVDPLNTTLVRLPGPHDGVVPNLKGYQGVVEEHTKRSIPQPGDFIRCITGILRPLCAGMSSPILEGLPGYFLEHFLLFRSMAKQNHRRDEFASYSWAGWDGPVEWPRENCIRYDKHGVPSYDPGHVLWWTKNQRLAMFETIEASARSERYSDWVYNDSPLAKLMSKYAHILGTMEDHKQYLQDYGDMAPGHIGCSSHMDLPNWESEKRFPTDEDGNVSYWPFSKDISQKAFELINGEVEYRELRNFIMGQSDTDLKIYFFGVSDARE